MSESVVNIGSQDLMLIDYVVIDHDDKEKMAQAEGEREKDNAADVSVKGKEKADDGAADGKDKGNEEDKKDARKEIAARSDMWQHFSKIKEKGVLQKGKCKYCHKDIAAHPVTNGTSALRKHFNSCKKNPHRNVKDAKQATLGLTHGDGPSTWKFDPKKIRKAFTKMLVDDELPFAFGEKSGFKKYMAIACPRFIVPSRRTSTRDTVKLFFEEKAKLKQFFKESCQRVCLTTDMWTSQQQDSYMTVTAHFIDKEWYLHKKIVSFFKVKGHKGDDIGKNLHSVLLDWGIDKIMTIIVDNASSNDSGISYLRKQVVNSKTGISGIAGGKYLHMRYAAHIINLIVSDGQKEVDLSVKRVRGAVRYVKNGTTRLVKFKECAELEKVETKAFLFLDVPTRWNSVHHMLKSACSYEKVFTRYVDEDPYFIVDLISETKGVPGPGVPDEVDWENARKLADFLGNFKEITNRVSATLHVIANRFFHEIGEINLLLKNLLESGDQLQVAMGTRMKDKYDKYWGSWHEIEQVKGKQKEKENMNLMIFIATALDPRYKLSEYTQFAIQEMFGEEKGAKVWSTVKACFRDLFDEYVCMYAPKTTTLQSTESQESKEGRRRGSMMKELIAKKMRLNSGASSSIKSKLEKYLAEECEEDYRKFNILAWWKINSSRFPILSSMARDVLAIPISTVASESAFITGGRVLDDFRTSLTPFMVEALVCTQDWLRRGTPICIEENIEELAQLEQELIDEFNEKAKIGSASKASKSTTTSKPTS